MPGSLHGSLDAALLASPWLGFATGGTLRFAQGSVSLRFYFRSPGTPVPTGSVSVCCLSRWSIGSGVGWLPEGNGAAGRSPEAAAARIGSLRTSGGAQCGDGQRCVAEEAAQSHRGYCQTFTSNSGCSLADESLMRSSMYRGSVPLSKRTVVPRL